jgi:hypothetical protein
MMALLSVERLIWLLSREIMSPPIPIIKRTDSRGQSVIQIARLKLGNRMITETDIA